VLVGANPLGTGSSDQVEPRSVLTYNDTESNGASASGDA
jgi:hypothetical protein